MKRFMFALLLALVTAQGVFAQGARPPFRVTVSPVTPPTPPQSIQITSPVGSPTQTTETALQVSGTVTALLVSEPVTWTNHTNSQTGMVDVDQLTRTFQVLASGGGSSQTVMRDDFTATASGNLINHVPTPDGVGAWTEYFDNTAGGANFCNARSSDYVQPDVSDSTGGKTLICEAVPTTYPSGTAYSLYHRLATAQWSASTSTNSSLIFGITATGWCVVDVLAATQNPDVVVSRVDSGVVQQTHLSLNIGPAAGQIFSITRSGNNFELFRDGVSQGLFTDATCASTKRVGLGWGETRPGSGKLIGTGLRLDDFQYDDPNSTSFAGIPLATSTTNNIEFQACELGGSPCYSTSIQVIQGVTDTEDPVVSITIPVSTPTYGTDVASIAIGGLVSDNDAVASVGVACAECTPITRTTTIANGQYNTTSNLTMATGVNHFIVTALDPSGNDAVATLNVTLSAAPDTTDPTVTITSPNSSGSNTTTTTPVSLGGTATDNVLPLPIGAVTWTSTQCGSGTAAGEANWSIPTINLTPPGCTVTVRVTDAAGRQSTDTHAFTYNQPLTIATPSSLTAIEGQAFSYCFQISGGTAPYTVVKLTGTYPTGFALTGSSPTFCIGDSSVNTGTAGSYTGHSYRVTDNVAATADTGTFTITVGTGGLGGQNNTLFNSICNSGRTDVFVCKSLRSIAELQSVGTHQSTLCPSNCQYNPLTGKYTWDYNPTADCATNVDCQDMAKITFHAFRPYPTPLTITSALSATPSGQTCGTGCYIDIVTFSPSNSVLKAGAIMKIDNEILTCMQPQGGSGGCLVSGSSTQAYMMRATYGTTLAAHSAGTQAYFNGNSLSNQATIPINGCATCSETVFAGVQMYFDASMGGMASPTTCAGVYNWPTAVSNLCAIVGGGYKGWQWRNPGINWETKPSTSVTIPVASIRPPGLNDVTGTDVAGLAFRIYSPTDGIHFLGQDPVRGANGQSTGTFIIHTSEHIYLYWLIELNADTNTAAFTTLTTLASSIPDTTSTSVVLDFSTIPAAAKAGDPQNPVTAVMWIDNDETGRRVRVDTEIMSITSCAAEVTNTVTCVVTRGVDGSTAATHSAGANFQVIWDYVSIWASSESIGVTQLLDRVPTLRLRANGNNVPLGAFNYEFNDSADRPIPHRWDINWADMHMYTKNFWSVHKSGTGGAGGGTLPAEWSGFLQQPPANGN